MKCESAYTRRMGLQDLVRFFARRRAQRPNCVSLSQMAERHGWKRDEVLAFVRCQKQPSKTMLWELANELDIPAEELQKILER
ncbi:MAG TPA: hypothetical protein VJS11_11815 [Acidobacteriaceae bacterium]|nr:hypothetical protein [Acidobacteriaceae bacterium]